MPPESSSSSSSSSLSLLLLSHRHLQLDFAARMGAKYGLSSNDMLDILDDTGVESDEEEDEAGSEDESFNDHDEREFQQFIGDMQQQQRTPDTDSNNKPQPTIPTTLLTPTERRATRASMTDQTADAFHRFHADADAPTQSSSSESGGW